MNLLYQAQAELAAAGSPRSISSAELNDRLKEGVLAVMVAKGLSFNETARAALPMSKHAESGFRKWLRGKRVRTLYGGQSPQRVSLGKAVPLAQWLEAHNPPPPAPPAPPAHAPAELEELDDIGLLLETRAAALGLASEQEIATAVGVPAHELRRIIAGAVPAPPSVAAWLAQPLPPV
jgi:hypothetical protein